MKSDELGAFEHDVLGQLDALDNLEAWMLAWFATPSNAPDRYVEWITGNALKALRHASNLDELDKAAAIEHLTLLVSRTRQNMQTLLDRKARRAASGQAGSQD